ncbi:MAG: hypothetical protein WEB06_12625 [Actinomycetota bacterium]
MMKRTLIVGLLVAAFVLVMSLGTVAFAGPQPLPGAACNQGTSSANTVAQDADTVAHYHDFDGDGTSACYHFNPTYPPPGPGSE